MNRLRPSGREKSIQSIWEWYEYHVRLSLLSKVGIQRKIVEGSKDIDPIFLGMTLDEVDDFFRELDYLTMLDLMVAAEAAIRLDYWRRVKRRLKDIVSKALRKLYREKRLKVRLDAELLSCWASARPALAVPIGDFRGALHLRHWLAHGRYWMKDFGRDYSPGEVYDICHNLLTAIAAY